MPEHLKTHWLCWKLISRGWATKEALQTTWTTEELLDASDVIDALDAANRGPSGVK